MDEPRHPRPLLRRRDWRTLDGVWEFAIDADARWNEPGEVRCDRRIRVPFAPETAASDVNDQGMYGCVWYRHRAELPSAAAGGRLLLRFGAVDHDATVWVDGTEVARHEGGYTPFAADVTGFAGGEHEIVVRAFDDPLDLEKPRGKQDWEPEPHAIWYPRTTGIWQSVWLEPLPPSAIVSLRWWTEDLRALALEAEIDAEDGATLAIRLAHRGEIVSRSEHRVVSRRVRAEIPVARADRLRWSPEHPALIDCDIELRDRGAVDRVHSYAALRTVSTHDHRVLLNGEAYPLRMALDQGYWADGGLTAPDDAALRRDVELARALGFNGVRKHQKAEDARWIEHCDRLGLLVFSEMPSPRTFSERAAGRLIREWREIVARDRSHPSVIAWVPFNESWGVESIDGDGAQLAHVTAVLELTRALDPTRLVVSNDGWEWAGGDLVGVHDYAVDPATLRERYGSGAAVARTLVAERPEGRRLLLAERGDRPVLLSEFGGMRMGSDREGWGFVTVDDDRYVSRFADLCAAGRSEALAGFCYTQLTDVYQERNGLLRMDRSPKAPLADLRAAVTGS